MNHRRYHPWLRLAFAALAIATLVIGSWKNPEFWQTADRRGDRLFSRGRFAAAAEAYHEPRRIGAAQYRNGDFEASAGTFGRVPGAEGAFNQGNAWLMHGNYDAAIASFNRALGFQPRWQEALDNKALAEARRKLLSDSGKDRDEEAAEAYEPDEIVFDGKGQDKKDEPKEMNGGEVSDEEMRSLWLRRVQTTPGDFLKAKFAWQAAQRNQVPREP
jgi:Ca-activated chloride channel family protein